MGGRKENEGCRYGQVGGFEKDARRRFGSLCQYEGPNRDRKERSSDPGCFPAPGEFVGFVLAAVVRGRFAEGSGSLGKSPGRAAPGLGPSRAIVRHPALDQNAGRQGTRIPTRG